MTDQLTPTTETSVKRTTVIECAVLVVAVLVSAFFVNFVLAGAIAVVMGLWSLLRRKWAVALTAAVMLAVTYAMQQVLLDSMRATAGL